MMTMFDNNIIYNKNNDNNRKDGDNDVNENQVQQQQQQHNTNYPSSNEPLSLSHGTKLVQLIQKETMRQLELTWDAQQQLVALCDEDEFLRMRNNNKDNEDNNNGNSNVIVGDDNHSSTDKNKRN